MSKDVQSASARLQAICGARQKDTWLDSRQRAEMALIGAVAVVKTLVRSTADRDLVGYGLTTEGDLFAAAALLAQAAASDLALFALLPASAAIDSDQVTRMMARIEGARDICWTATFAYGDEPPVRRLTPAALSVVHGELQAAIDWINCLPCAADGREAA